ncbi:unnamed protein product [Amoebophrya sp. A120]|nr:unnamed protein product [Amoebophrya sp. A120]|eukprot:GSA120T00022955001.1
MVTTTGGHPFPAPKGATQPRNASAIISAIGYNDEENYQEQTDTGPPIAQEFVFRPKSEIQRRIDESPARNVQPSSGRLPGNGNGPEHQGEHAFWNYRVPRQDIRAAAQVHTSRPEKVPMLNLVRETKTRFTPENVLEIAYKGGGMLRRPPPSPDSNRCCGRACDGWFGSLFDDSEEQKHYYPVASGKYVTDSDFPPLSVAFPSNPDITLEGYLEQVSPALLVNREVYLVLLRDGRLFQFANLEHFRKARVLLLRTIQSENKNEARKNEEAGGANGGAGTEEYYKQLQHQAAIKAEAIYPFAPLGNCRAVRGHYRGTIELLDWRGYVIAIFASSSNVAGNANPSAEAWLQALAECDALSGRWNR